MSPSLTIRNATVADAQVLTSLSVATFVHSFAAYNTKADMDMYVSDNMSVERLTSELADVENVFFLAFAGDTPIAYAKVHRKNMPGELAGHNPLEIERIYVHYDYHSLKVGAAMMQHCIDYALSLDCDLIWLGVWEHNAKAIAFYERWGFQLFGSHPFILGTDKQTDILMKKEIGL